MFTSVRAGLAAALIALALFPAMAADKAFKRGDLDDAAIKLEAQIKNDTGTVTKPAATLRRDADAAFQKNDFRTGMTVLGQLVTVAPSDASNWLRLARTVLQIHPRDDRERALLLDRATTAAYIAYQRASGRDAEADSLALLGKTFADRKMWRPALDSMRLALDLRESADLRGQYERLRGEYGFRMLDYSVDSDAISPRVCFQFSEELPSKRTDFSPYVAVAGQDKAAISANDKQLCVEGLKHGERYEITLRAGLPSVVREALAKSAQFTIFVRDRKPFVRFSGKAYVLPRSGQRGIPVLSVNSSAVTIAVYRIGDRNLLDTVLGSDFQRNLSQYDAERIASENGAKVWSGELAVTPKLNTEVATAFPVDQAVGDLKAGVYVMTATPKEAVANDYGQRASQWFIVSDLGLTAYSGHDGIDVFIHSLASAKPLGQVAVRLVARNNEVLATKSTDKDGFLHFEAGLTRGEGGQAPAAIVAADNGDYAFLSLKSPAFDLSDRGVAGRQVPTGLDAFVYTERGVYRSGETVHVTSLLRDARGIAAAAPLTLVMERPDGVEYRRALLPDQGLGGHSWSVPIVRSASTGTWRVAAYTDPKRPPIGEATFLVEDYVPDRIEFDLKSEAKVIPRDAPAQLSVDGHFLYGAPASNLELQGTVTIAAAKERPGFAGYSFGLEDDEVSAVRQELGDLPATDATGKASFPVTLEKVPSTSRPLEATITVSMAESGGRAVERKITLPIAPEAAMIGVKPAFSGRSLDDGANADFDVVMVAPDGKTLAQKGLHYDLLRVETTYQWYRQNGSWEFEPVKRTERVADGNVDVSADKPARVSLPVRWGRYRLEVSVAGQNGTTTSITFDAGFYAESSADTPDLLEVALDKNDFKSGDTMNVSVTARTAGRLTLNVFTDRLVASTSQDVKAGAVQAPLTIGKDWGTGAYLVATLRRPLDAPAQRMPGRAIGVQWFSIDRTERTLALDMKLPSTMRPDNALNVPIKLTGLAAGEEAHVVVAAVDVGILNLTNYKPPAPDNYYLGQRQLTAEIRDLYGQLIDGMQGVRGQIRSGGDSGAELTGPPPTQAPLALYSGIVSVGPDGTAQVSFDIPAFTGTVRVMAVAWSKDKVGKASGDVVVRDPVVLTTTLPRFLRTGDRGNVQLELDNVEGAAGDYSIAVSSDGTVKLDGGKPLTLTLAAKQRDHVAVPVSAAGAGASMLKVNVSGPNGFALERSYALDVRPANQILTRRTVRSLAPGETLTLSNDMFADFVPGTGRVGLSVAISASLDIATLLNELDRYPFGCSEQITSRAMAMLYINELAAQAKLALDGDIDQRIKDAIQRLLARQDSNGSFGLWTVGGNDSWLDAYVTDFLTRARERNFEVPQAAFTQALDRLRNYVASTADVGKNGGRDLAYALYVLARNGVAPVGDLRYIADTKLDDLSTPIAKAQVAAALAMLGDKTRADRVYLAALDAIPRQPRLELDLGRVDYGSVLRDSAAVVTLASEGRAPQRTIDDAVARIDAARALSSRTSTQEDAWLVLAARALVKQVNAISLSVNGETRQGAFYRSLRADQLDTPLAVSNRGDGAVQAVVSVSGSPTTPEPAAERGFKIERSYFTLDGEPADVTKAKQNQRFAVVLKMTEPNPQFGRVIVADYLPAGFEIDNPRLVSSGDTGTLSWITDAVEPANSEFRDDRFTAAFDREENSPSVFAVAYVVRAVSPGHYVLPQAVVEDMYRPDRFGRTAMGTIDITAGK
ncbi:MAG TPA: alpha-2-macroglobulin [Pseudolabrys sp.]|nr:alpha-2-macroglobulin [Pseudolabrys sp.]